MCVYANDRVAPWKVIGRILAHTRVEWRRCGPWISNDGNFQVDPFRSVHIIYTEHRVISAKPTVPGRIVPTGINKISTKNNLQKLKSHSYTIEIL